MNSTLRNLLLLTPRSGNVYLLRDQFVTFSAAGTVNGALSEPGPGTRVLVDSEIKLLIGGNTIFVAKTGNNANAGTAALPVLTIAQANTLANADATITTIAIGVGTYTEAVVVPRARLTYVSYGGTAIIDGATNTAKGIYSVYAVTILNLTIQNATYGIELDGSTGAGRVVGALIYGCTITNSNTGVYSHHADYTTIQNCLAHDITVQSGFWNYSSTRPTLRNCEAYACNSRGFYTQNTTFATLVDCYAHDQLDTNDYGFEFESSSNDAVVLRCWATNCFHGFISKLSFRTRFEACVAWLNTSAGFYFKNGLNGFVYQCDSYLNLTGILLDDNVGSDPSTGNTIKNCIVAANTNYQISVRNGSSSGLVSDYNDIQFGSCSLEAVAKNSLAAWQASGYDANGKSVAPAYVTTVYNGFALPGGSALLGAGTSIGGSTTPNLGHTGSTYVA